ncbi:MAG: thiamine phosphate synthase [Chlorobiaceae bacterium]|nr:thiamine phosphate synthase [Chlorobiaceae bacterium]
MCIEKQDKFSLPRICIVSSGKESDPEKSPLISLLKHLPEMIPCMVQIREKHLDAKHLFMLCREAKEIDLPPGTLLLLNERADIASAAGIDGVHLPESGCPAEKLRAFASGLIYGRSVHSIESARIAEDSGADFLLFGPVFDTPSKRQYGKPQGLDQLEKLCNTTALPVYAIGGVNPENAGSCRERGAFGMAALSLFHDITKLSRTLELLDRIWQH